MAAPAPENMTEDLTDTMWRDDEWLKYYHLTRHNALDYFAVSTFNDPNSLNDRARQQGLQPSQVPCALNPGPAVPYLRSCPSDCLPENAALSEWRLGGVKMEARGHSREYPSYLPP